MSDSKKIDKKDVDLLHFNVDTPSLLEEITNRGLSHKAGVLKIPLNIFKGLLAQVAKRAAELDDPKLNILMLRLWLYEVEPENIQSAIENQKNRLKDEPRRNQPNRV